MGRTRKYLQPDEVPEEWRDFIDFAKQDTRHTCKRWRLYVWVQCPDCREWRWVMVKRLRPGRHQAKSLLCKSCFMRQLQNIHTPSIPGGYVTNHGYRRFAVKELPPEDQALASQMLVSRGRPRSGMDEHRLVAARCLGRPLAGDEHVHHRDGAGLNNAPDNLMIVSRALHYHLTQLERLAAAEALTVFTADGEPYRARARVVFERA